MLEHADRGSAAQRKAWVAEAQAICKEWGAKYQGALTSDAVPIRPERICGDLSKHVPDDAIVVVDTGHAGMWMGGMYDLTSPRQSYMRSAGHLGWAFPAGLGAKCAVPERPVVTFTGDAGFWYHIAEIETAVRWKINAVTVVNNNGGGNQSKRGFDRVYGGKQTERRPRAVDLQQDELRPARRGHGRARHPGREAGRDRRRARAGAHGRPAGGDRRRHRHRRARAAGGELIVLPYSTRIFGRGSGGARRVNCRPG